MDKTSTPLAAQRTSKTTRPSGPSKKTMDFIRQFARVYMPLPALPGVVLN